jgi:hypothetical protein
MTEEALAALLEFIRHTGQWRLYGKGITTSTADADSALKHEACLELERRGLIARRAQREGCVIWMSVEVIL